MKGYVYVLSNPSMPGLVKIGRTVRSVEGRANELYQTGVPTPFVVEHDVLSPNCAELEALAHAAFSEFRVGDGREFFRVSADEVRTFLDEGVFCQIEDFVLEYSEDYGVGLGDWHVVSFRKIKKIKVKNEEFEIVPQKLKFAICEFCEFSGNSGRILREDLEGGS